MKRALFDPRAARANLRPRLPALLALLVLSLLLAGTPSRVPAASAPLALVHINDTHSHLEPLPVDLEIDGIRTTVELGGFARIKTILDEFRAEAKELLLLHGGDAVQGTAYFPRFGGAVEFDFLNLLGVDAMTFGNHEFDLGPAPIPGWINRSRFPWLAANIDFSGEPAIAPLTRPFLIKEIDGEKVGIIGLTTEDTPLLARDVGRAVFHDPVAAARRQVETLTTRGINRIVVLSHLGYRRDLDLAAKVSGIDIIVGGHSHSLLSDAGPIRGIGGLTPEGPYPTVATAPDGKTVLVLQAWQWGHAVGSIRVDFTAAGEVAGYRGAITIPCGGSFKQNGAPVPPESDAYRRIVRTLSAGGAARITPEDRQTRDRLAPYARQVAGYREAPVAVATQPIVRGPNRGPGPLAADSMLASCPEARLSLLNSGAVRRDFNAGTVSVADVMEALPFGNTLVLVDLTGRELRRTLEEYLAFLARRYPRQTPPPMPYVAGARLAIRPAAPEGSRVQDILIRDPSGAYRPADPQAVYRVVVNAFMAGGGDGMTTLGKAAGFRADTGIVDQDAFRDHLRKLGSFGDPAERRITIIP
ncbi:MAG: bifunctional metallophosphatase/5'-nucleotidase [Pseudomonadota bacterium]|nr:bifunctional metallophosphatase/5'-nucleotidase [Pseudomonadota bacterium]